MQYRRIEEVMSGRELSYLRKVESEFFSDPRILDNQGNYTDRFVSLLLDGFSKYRDVGDIIALRKLVLKLCGPERFVDLAQAISERSHRLKSMAPDKRQELEKRLVELRLEVEEAFASDIMEFLDFCDQTQLSVEGFSTLTDPESIRLHDQWFDQRSIEIKKLADREKEFYDFLRKIKSGENVEAPDPKQFEMAYTRMRERYDRTPGKPYPNDPEDQPFKFIMESIQGESDPDILNVKRAIFVKLLSLGLGRLKSLRKLVTTRKFETDYFQARINKLRSEIESRVGKTHQRLASAMTDALTKRASSGKNSAAGKIDRSQAAAADIFTSMGSKRVQEVLSSGVKDISAEIKKLEGKLVKFYEESGQRPARMRHMLEKVEICLGLYRDALKKKSR